MLTLDNIKKRIKELYETNPNIHVNVSISSPKIVVTDFPVVITGIYPHIFQIEENYSGRPKRHSIQYNDVLTNHFNIAEL